MDVNISRKNQSLAHTVQYDGLDLNLFKVIEGFPVLNIGKTDIQISEVRMASRPSFLYGNFAFKMTLPVAPVTGQDKLFGLLSDQSIATPLSAAVFVVAGGVFAVGIYTDGVDSVKLVNWDAAWTATEAIYEIQWGADAVTFRINNVIVASFKRSIPTDIEMPYKPSRLYFKNENADALLLGEVSVTECADISTALVTDEWNQVAIDNYYESKTFTITGAQTNYSIKTEQSVPTVTRNVVNIKADVACTIKFNDTTLAPIGIAAGETRTFDHLVAINDIFVTTTATTVIRVELF